METETPEAAESLSGVFVRLLDPARGATITLREMLEGLGERGFGALILLLCVPNFLPVSIPGFSALTGLPIAVMCGLLLAGVRKPWMPASLLDRGVDRAAYAAVVRRFLPHLRRVEGFVGPYYPTVTSPLGERFIGLFGIPVAILLAAPIPFGNPPPAIALALLAIGIVERDGRFVIAGYVAGVLAFGLVAAIALGLLGAGFAMLGS